MQIEENQLELFKDLKQSLIPKFLEYHKKNPTVYEKFKEFAFQTKRIGHKRFSARGLFQVMRWKMGGKIKEDGFKYNNNHTPFYVRIIEQEHPNFIGFFEKRKSESDLLEYESLNKN